MSPGRQDEAGDALLRSQPPDILAEIIDVLSEGLALFDEDSRLIRSNIGFRELNPLIADIISPGLSWEMMLREALNRGAIPASVHDRLQWMENRLTETTGPVVPVELVLPNGRVQEIALRATPSGSFVVTQNDVTHRKQSEENERQADILLRKVLEACPANVIMSRVGDGTILYRSPAATELLGMSRNSHDHFASREERADFITSLLPSGRVDDMEAAGLRPDGSRFPCQISARMIEYRGEEVIVSSTVDVSKDVALRKTLAAQREQLFQSEKMSALGELLAGVAHELNNPLSIVVGQALMMQEEAIAPEILRRVEKISGAAERCARIVKSFLAMARQQPVQLAAIELRETVDVALDAMRQGTERRRTPVTVDLPDDLPMLQGDAHQLSQVLLNLLINADQAITETGIGSRIHISAAHDENQGTVEIRVMDDGPGIPASIRNRIFDPLFTTKVVGQGTGIGLAYCHRVITAHSGTILLDTDAGDGAAFVLALPVALVIDAGTDSETSAAEEALPARILVVEDEAEVADLIREILRRDGFAVDTAGSAETGLKLLQTHAYQLVLSDLNMPGVGGRGLYEAVQRRSPALARRIAFVTGDTMSPQARGFLKSAGRPFLEKPIAPAELRTLIHRMLAARPEDRP